MDSVSTSLNIYNSNIIKTNTSFHQIMTAIAKIRLIFKTDIFKIPIMANITYHILLISLFY